VVPSSANPPILDDSRSSLEPVRFRIAIPALVFGALSLLAACQPYDFDVDGKADRAYVDEVSGEWTRAGETSPFHVQTHAEAEFRVPAPGDYDDNGVWEAGSIGFDGVWETAGSQGSFLFAPSVPVFLGDGWLPVPANYDGLKGTEAAWYSTIDGTWMIEGQSGNVTFGVGTEEHECLYDLPVPADYDGDGDDDIAVFRPWDGTFHVHGIGQIADLPPGIPAPAKYDGDADADPSVLGLTADTWYVAGESPAPWPVGHEATLPIPGNYTDAPGAERAVFERRSGVGESAFVVEGAPDVTVAGSDDLYPAALAPWLLFDFIRMATIEQMVVSGEPMPEPDESCF
jgi:hypothetical protein